MPSCPEVSTQANVPSGLVGLKGFPQRYSIVEIQSKSSGHLNMAKLDPEQLRWWWSLLVKHIKCDRDIQIPHSAFLYVYIKHWPLADTRLAYILYLHSRYPLKVQFLFLPTILISSTSMFHASKKQDCQATFPIQRNAGNYIASLSALTWHCAVPSKHKPRAAGKDVGHKINFLCCLTRTGCSPGPNRI